jgi:hypothetical protein
LYVASFPIPHCIGLSTIPQAHNNWFAAFSKDGSVYLYDETEAIPLSRIHAPPVSELLGVSRFGALLFRSLGGAIVPPSAVVQPATAFAPAPVITARRISWDDDDHDTSYFCDNEELLLEVTIPRYFQVDTLELRWWQPAGSASDAPIRHGTCRNLPPDQAKPGTFVLQFTAAPFDGQGDVVDSPLVLVKYLPFSCPNPINQYVAI